MARALVCALVCGAVLACTRGPATAGADDFHLEVRSYNWEIDGWDMINVDADGHGKYVYVRGIEEQWPLEKPDARGETTQTVRVPHWFMVEWDASPEQLSALQGLIDDGGFFGLHDEYEDSSVDDGVTTTYRVRARGQTKLVRCINEFPNTVEAIDEYLDEIKPAGAPGPIAGERELDERELGELGLIPQRTD